LFSVGSPLSFSVFTTLLMPNPKCARIST
jgi:hypothetical protein